MFIHRAPRDITNIVECCQPATTCATMCVTTCMCEHSAHHANDAIHVSEKWNGMLGGGGGGGGGLTGDTRPLYFTTTCEPRTLRRLCENFWWVGAFQNGEADAI